MSSATPPGTTPTFTLAGCATSQTVVAQMLVRLRLISGVSNVALQSSTKAGSWRWRLRGGGTCPANDPVFTATSASNRCPPADPAPSVQARDLGDPASGAARRAPPPPSTAKGAADDRARPHGVDAVVVLVVLAGGWLLVVSPERKEAARPAGAGAERAPAAPDRPGQADSERSAEARYTSAYVSVVKLGKAVPPARKCPRWSTNSNRPPTSASIEFNSITQQLERLASSSAAPRRGRGPRRRPRPSRRCRSRSSSRAASTGLAHLLGQIDGFAQRNTAGHLTVSGRLLTIQGADIAVQTRAARAPSGSSSGSAHRDDHRHRLRAARQPGPDRRRHRRGPAATTASAAGSSAPPATPAVMRDAMNEILTSLKSDLLDRRLLPSWWRCAVALAGAVAYVVLDGGASEARHDALGRSWGSAGGAPNQSAASHGAMAVSEAHANPHAAVAETTEGARYQHKPRRAQPLHPAPLAEDGAEATAQEQRILLGRPRPPRARAPRAWKRAAPARPTRVARRPRPRLP